MADLVMTVEEVREELGAFLTKPLSVTSGELSTQQDFSVTSIGAGGVQGKWEFGANGQIIVPDGTNRRVLIGKLS
jgi:hypothetical protein